MLGQVNQEKASMISISEIKAECLGKLYKYLPNDNYQTFCL